MTELTIEQFESLQQQRIAELEIPQDEKIPTIAEIEAEFEGAVQINPDEILAKFEQWKDQPEIKIVIPVNQIEDTIRQQELLAISKDLRSAIFAYTGLSVDNNIGFDTREIIGEATSDIGKHTSINQKFKEIKVLVAKNGRKLTFHLVNPAKSDTDLNQVDPDVQIADYTGIHGRKGLTLMYKDDLKNEHCQVEDNSAVIRDDQKNTAVSREIVIELPEAA